MTNKPSTVLVLAGTGKTGRRVVAHLTRLGVSARSAARHAADVAFDWSDTATYRLALAGADAVYLVPPAFNLDFLAPVTTFLDAAEEAGVRHVTYLSAYGVEAAPPEVALRAVELELAARSGLTHTILRPAWFMQNFSESFLRPVEGAISLPAGGGAEAFVDAEDIAAVAAATLTDSATHAGAAYAPTGPESLTFAEAARVISNVTGTATLYHDRPRDQWVAENIAAGLPADYAGMLGVLTETIAAGRGAVPNRDVEAVTGRAAITFREFVSRELMQ